MRFLTRDQLSDVLPTEDAGFSSPLPVQIASSDEYLPAPQTSEQRPVKNAILGQNAVRIFGCDQHAELASPDRLAALKSEYERMGQGRSNLRHGYIVNPM